MIVMKFGGTSVGSVGSIQAIHDIVISQKAASLPIVVVSAVGGITNMLVELSNADATRADTLVQEIETRHYELINGLWPEGEPELEQYVKATLHHLFEEANELDGQVRTDKIVSIGEILSSRIVSAYLSKSHPSEQIVATRLLVTDDSFGAAEVRDQATRLRVESFVSDMRERAIIPVVTGFIAATEDGQTTTLGRGGSDYTAALLGYYANADEVQIWTDVDGVFSADPRHIPAAQLIPEVTYQEAAELAAFGAKVLHPKTMRPAVFGNVPIRIANTFRPDAPTTNIVAESSRKAEVVAVASKRGVVMVNIYAVEMLLERGFLARISSVFSKFNISIDIISASETSVSVTLDNHEKLDKAIAELEQFSTVTVNDTVGLVSLIGQGIATQPGLLAVISQTLHDMNVALNMVSLGAQGINISLVIASHDVDRVTNALHKNCVEENI